MYFLETLDECPVTLYPQCDLTLQGMGCIAGRPGGYYHQSEEYTRATLALCSHDGLPPILAPDANGAVTPVVSFAVIRNPFVRAEFYAHSKNRCGESLASSNLASSAVCRTVSRRSGRTAHNTVSG